MFPIRVFFCGLLCLLVSGCAHSPAVPPVSIGDQVNFDQLRDQFGHSFDHLDAMHMALYADDMTANDLVHSALVHLNKECMKNGQLVYLADISGMPSLISKLIAIPRMRKYSYPIWLDYDGRATAGLPAKKGRVTVLKVKKGTIKSVEFVSDPRVLSNRLKPLCGLAKIRAAGDSAS